MKKIIILLIIGAGVYTTTSSKDTDGIPSEWTFRTLELFAHDFNIASEDGGFFDVVRAVRSSEILMDDTISVFHYSKKALPTPKADRKKMKMHFFSEYRQNAVKDINADKYVIAVSFPADENRIYLGHYGIFKETNRKGDTINVVTQERVELEEMVRTIEQQLNGLLQGDGHEVVKTLGGNIVMRAYFEKDKPKIEIKKI
jgi:hypothetical protein